MAKISFRLDDPELDDDGLQCTTEELLRQIREVDGVVQARLAATEVVPEGSKAIGSFLVGVLTAEINLENAKGLTSFLANFLFRQRTIEVEVEANSKKLRIKAGNEKELVAAIEAIKDFVYESK